MKIYTVLHLCLIIFSCNQKVETLETDNPVEVNSEQDYFSVEVRDDQFTVGILAMEYAFEHQDKLKGLITSNMMASAAD